jgi:15-cis-phytoene synthase
MTMPAANADVALLPAPSARAVFQHHSRTFSAAAEWLAPRTHDAIAQVYVFCRTVDDLADERADALALDALAEELRGLRAPSPLAAGMLALRAQGVPMEAAAQLVDGCRSDLEVVRIADEAALVRYGYLVAGTVGRITSPLLGATDPRSVPFAIDLGIGMQLSNIARDVGEDAARGRVYLPATWLADACISAEDVLNGGRDDRVAKVVERLLAVADRYYASADRGLQYLPLRPRVAVALASRRYQAIGHLVRSRGEAAVRDRSMLGWAARVRFLVSAPFVALMAGGASAHEPGHEPGLHAPIRDLLGQGVAP